MSLDDEVSEDSSPESGAHDPSCTMTTGAKSFRLTVCSHEAHEYTTGLLTWRGDRQTWTLGQIRDAFKVLFLQTAISPLMDFPRQVLRYFEHFVRAVPSAGFSSIST